MTLAALVGATVPHVFEHWRLEFTRCTGEPLLALMRATCDRQLPPDALHHLAPGTHRQGKRAVSTVVAYGTQQELHECVKRLAMVSRCRLYRMVLLDPAAKVAGSLLQPGTPSPPALLVVLAEWAGERWCDTVRAMLAERELISSHLHHNGTPSVVDVQFFSSAYRRHLVVLCSNAGRWWTNDSPSKCTWEAQAVAKALASFRSVRRVEPISPFQLQNDVATRILQSTQDLDRPMWRGGLTGVGQVVLVGDSGVDFDSCFFDDPDQHVATWPEVNFAHRKVVSYNPCIHPQTKRPDVGDVSSGHGTHVAGTLAGNAGHNSKSFASASQVEHAAIFNGVAKDAKLVIDDMACDGTSDMNIGDVYEFLSRGKVAGAYIASGSWGTDAASTSYTAAARRADEYVAEHPDMVALFAAGNVPRLGTIDPAVAKNVLAIGSHRNSRDPAVRDTLAPNTAFGATFDNRIKPDVLSPGHTVVSAKSDGALQTHQCITETKFGTSMATPGASGATTLLRQYLVDGYYPTGVRTASDALPRPSSALLRAALVNSAMHFATSATTPDTKQGHGRIEIANSIFLKSTSNGAARCHVHYIDNAKVTHRGDAVQFCVATAPDASSPVHDMSVTLVWTDPAVALEGATETVVNDLDLAVVPLRSSTVHRGNHGDAPDGGFDPDNVVERVIVKSPFGKYTVSVVATHVDVVAEQLFSLVLSAPSIDVTAGPCSASGDPVCPGGCSGHGTCVTLDSGVAACRCEHGYRHIDCSTCDSQLLCNGNGRCHTATKQCTCFAPEVDQRKASDCSVCADGWYGPHCLSTCQCLHGTCDHRTGVCTCDASHLLGFWAGEYCDRCAFDHVRNPPPQLAEASGAIGCRTPSYWCRPHEVREVVVVPGETAVLHINDDGAYEDSLTCFWKVRSASTTHRLTLSFSSFDTEPRYDAVVVYRDSVDAEAPTQIPSGRATRTSGDSAPQPTVADYNESLFLAFRSDLITDPGHQYTGFVALAAVPVCDDQQCHGHGACNPSGEACVCVAPAFDPAANCGACIGGFVGYPACDQYVGDGNHSGGPTPMPSLDRGACISAVDGGVLCSGRGQCKADGSGCACDLPLWTGRLCELACPVENEQATVPCGGVGSCVEGRTAAVCECGPMSDRTGVACQLQLSNMFDLQASRPLLHLTLPSKGNTDPNPSRLIRYQPAILPPIQPTSTIETATGVKAVLVVQLRLAATGPADLLPHLILPVWSATATAQLGKGRAFAHVPKHLATEENGTSSALVGCLDVYGWDDSRYQPLLGLGFDTTSQPVSSRGIEVTVSVTARVEHNLTNIAAAGSECMDPRRVQEGLCGVVECAHPSAIAITRQEAPRVSPGVTPSPSPQGSNESEVRRTTTTTATDPLLPVVSSIAFVCCFVVGAIGAAVHRLQRRRRTRFYDTLDGRAAGDDGGNELEEGRIAALPPLPPMFDGASPRPPVVDQNLQGDDDDTDAGRTPPAVQLLVEDQSAQASTPRSAVGAPAVGLASPDIDEGGGSVATTGAVHVEALARRDGLCPPSFDA